MVQYLVSEYEGPLTPASSVEAASIANLWAWVNDYYSFVLSPLHDIITGHNEDGKSIITLDGPPACSIGEDVGGLYELWNTDGNEIDSKDEEDRANKDIILSPSKGGTKFRYFQINPLPEGVPDKMLQEIAADAFEKIGAAHHRVDTSKHPAMHKTETIDYIVLLKGDVTLILDLSLIHI